jgi:tripartite-type tricarboxylate transporter receptor subunit TctC
MRRAPLALIALSVAAASHSFAASYPTKPVTLVITYAPGGTTDLIGRLIADGLKEQLRQPVVVLNKPGAGGEVGLQYAAAAAPDGCTLVISTNAITSGRYVSKNFKLHFLNDFTHIVYLAEGHDLLMASPRLQVKGAADLIAYAKAHPGVLNIASWAPSSDLNAGMLMHRAGIKLTIIPYRGSTPAILALAADEIDLVLSGNPVSRPLIEDKKLTALGVGSLKPYRLAPGIPLLTDTGVPGFESRGAWFGLSGPKGIPDDIVQTLNSAVNAILQRPSVKEQINNVLMHEVIGGTPDDFIAALKADDAFFGEAARVTGYEAK